MRSASLSHRVIAIDGPAASGKSSVSKRVAERLGFAFVSSGLMYRAFTSHVCRSGVDPRDTARVTDLLRTTRFGLARRDHELYLEVDGGGARSDLTSNAVNRAVSHVAKIKEVREALVAWQRACADESDLVMEGRDIGSVVFPDTPYKFYLDAREDVRAARRSAEGLADTVAERDRMDSARTNSPLCVAEGAAIVDTSELTLEEVVEKVLELLGERGLTA